MSANKKLPLSRSHCVWLPLSLGIALLCSPVPSRADSLEDAARTLARKAAVLVKGSSTTIETLNKSGLSEQRVSDFGRAFQEEMQRRGAKTLPANGEWKIRLTLSSNATECLAILNLGHNDATQTYIESLGQLGGKPTPLESGSLNLKRELVFSSDQPTLDLIFADDNPNSIEVLDVHQLISFERDRDHWVRGTGIKLPRNGPVERDLRGQLYLGLDVMSAVFPAEICNLSIHDGESCHPNRGQARLSEVPDETVSEKQSPPWITATQYFNEGKSVLFVAGADGKMRVYAEDDEPIATADGFGDQLTSVRTDCTGGWQALVTLNGDRSKPDSVQGIEIRGSKLVVVTPAVSFEGPILALRRASRSIALPASSAIAITFNLQTGLYEVYRLTVTCAN